MRAGARPDPALTDEGLDGTPDDAGTGPSEEPPSRDPSGAGPLDQSVPHRQRRLLLAWTVRVDRSAIRARRALQGKERRIDGIEGGGAVRPGISSHAAPRASPLGSRASPCRRAPERSTALSDDNRRIAHLASRPCPPTTRLPIRLSSRIAMTPQVPPDPGPNCALTGGSRIHRLTSAPEASYGRRTSPGNETRAWSGDPLPRSSSTRSDPVDVSAACDPARWHTRTDRRRFPPTRGTDANGAYRTRHRIGGPGRDDPHPAPCLATSPPCPAGGTRCRPPRTAPCRSRTRCCAARGHCWRAGATRWPRAGI